MGVLYHMILIDVFNVKIQDKRKFIQSQNRSLEISKIVIFPLHPLLSSSLSCLSQVLNCFHFFWNQEWHPPNSKKEANYYFILSWIEKDVLGKVSIPSPSSFDWLSYGHKCASKWLSIPANKHISLDRLHKRGVFIRAT